ncbi:MAG TPA: hypothetical protein VE978_11690 [Chitinophagales bacterium]|nr:hypothetical protein [Chitinophagales bacterium]
MGIIKWTLVILGLIIFDQVVLECLLRVGGLFKNIAESSLDKELKSADYIFDFSPNMNGRLKALGLESKFDLGSFKNEKRIPYPAVEEYNPYPPILDIFDTAFVLYNKDFKLRQITILSGECDATPSILVDKARGKETGFGDHFVTYIFYQDEMSGIGVDYDRIDWYSWRGGSYNGFEELLVVPMLLIEIIFLLLLKLITRWRKKRAITAHLQ